MALKRLVALLRNFQRKLAQYPWPVNLNLETIFSHTEPSSCPLFCLAVRFLFCCDARSATLDQLLVIAPITGVQ